MNLPQVVALDIDAFVHLSHVVDPALIIAERRTTNFRITPFLRPSERLDLNIWVIGIDFTRLLSQIRLTAITCFYADILEYNCRQELASFVAGIVASNSSHTITLTPY